MVRPHIEFIHTQQLEWTTDLFPAFPGVAGKMLSQDDTTGACSVLMRFPKGWKQAGPLALSAAQEAYVLDGALELNGLDYTLDCYAHLPVGFVRTSMSAPTGCDVMVFFDGTPNVIEGDPAVEPIVPILNSHEMEWQSDGMDPYYADWGMAWKILSHDPATNATSMLVSIPPMVHPKDWKGPREIHDCMEEAFVLSGDLYTFNGVFHEGMYFYRPPRITHGPFASRFGSVILVRVDGILENNWSVEETEVSFHPPHAPVLPPELVAAAGQAWQPGPRY